MKVFVVEDQQLFREVLVQNLQTMLGAEVCGSYSDTFSAARDMKILATADIGLVDLRLEKGDSLELVDRLQREAPRVRLIWVTSVVEDFLFEQAYMKRLPGFVHKGDSLEVLAEAVRTVASGKSFVSDRVRSIRASIRAKPNHFSLILSSREQEVLRYIGSGLSNEETAAFLGLSAGTVQAHRRNIMKRLELHTAAELVTYAVQNGFCDPAALRRPN